MQAITVVPGRAGSVGLTDLAGPAGEGAVLARMRAVGVCGTDREIIDGRYGTAPPGSERLVLGHESLAEVLEAPPGCGLAPGDLIAGVVRRPDPVPCPHCAVGEWDLCRNGLYRERGIKELHGYAAEHIRIEPDFAIRLDPGLGALGVLLEPASVVAKAWDHVYRLGRRALAWKPRTALVTGAGPVGLLAALLARQLGLEVHVYDRVEAGLKPELVRELGGTYHCGGVEALARLHPDVVIECTGVGTVVLAVLECSAPDGVVCLAGLSSGDHRVALDLSVLNRQMVLENDVVFGSVNANRRHYEGAAAALAAADRAWLARLITRRVPLARWREAYERRDGDVKVVLEFGD